MATASAISSSTFAGQGAIKSHSELFSRKLVCDLKTPGVLCTFYNPTLKTSPNLVVKAVKAANDASGTATVGAHRKRAKTKLKEPEETVKDEEDNDNEEEKDWPPLVCCFGEALHEFVPTVRVSDRQMDPEIYSSWKGLQWSPPEFVRAPGSSAANVAIALARLGGRVAFVGKVGDDEFGHKLVLTLNINRVQTRGVKFDPDVDTGVSWMRLTYGAGAGTKMVCEKPSAEACLLLTEVNLDIIKEACLLQCSSISLTYEPLRSTLISAINRARKKRADVFFDLNLPLPYWKSRDETWSAIQPVWEKSTMFELTKQELEFLLGEETYEWKRQQHSVYYAKSAAEMKPGRDEYHYMPEELSPLWHKHIRILFVTDGTYRIHYYTQDFHGSVEGTEDVLLAPFSCDRTGSGDAVVAALIKKLTTQPELLHDQTRLEKALRFAICAGIIAQWTIGAIRGYPTESAAQNLTEQVYQPTMV